MLIGISVYAANTLNLGVTTNVGFTANGVAGRVNCELDGGYIEREQNLSATYFTPVITDGVVNSANYEQIGNIFVFKDLTAPNDIHNGKKIYVLSENSYVTVTDTSTFETTGTFAVNAKSGKTTTFTPGANSFEWNVDNIEFQENPINTIAPITYTFSIENNGFTDMAVKFSSLNSVMTTEQTNLNVEYSIDGIEYTSFVGESAPLNAIPFIPSGGNATLIVKLSIKTDTISINDGLDIDFSLSFAKHEPQIDFYTYTSENAPNRIANENAYVGYQYVVFDGASDKPENRWIVIGQGVSGHGAAVVDPVNELEDNQLLLLKETSIGENPYDNVNNNSNYSTSTIKGVLESYYSNNSLRNYDDIETLETLDSISRLSNDSDEVIANTVYNAKLFLLASRDLSWINGGSIFLSQPFIIENYLTEALYNFGDAWFLRTGGVGATNVTFLTTEGDLLSMGAWASLTGATRPAMVLNLEVDG